MTQESYVVVSVARRLETAIEADNPVKCRDACVEIRDYLNSTDIRDTDYEDLIEDIDTLIDELENNIEMSETSLFDVLNQPLYDITNRTANLYLRHSQLELDLPEETFERLKDINPEEAHSKLDPAEIQNIASRVEDASAMSNAVLINHVLTNIHAQELIERTNAVLEALERIDTALAAFPDRDTVENALESSLETREKAIKANKKYDEVTDELKERFDIEEDRD